ncbi:uncharacterized protein LOC141900549 [Tubulanus polymorphus]|uniref:uncharacterized protein LOC141900549 n=1 Tax=Tubulanus polymorphus TaxID=672921 RepID=UPI003DA4D0EB
MNKSPQSSYSCKNTAIDGKLVYSAIKTQVLTPNRNNVKVVQRKQSVCSLSDQAVSRQTDNVWLRTSASAQKRKNNQVSPSPPTPYNHHSAPTTPDNTPTTSQNTSATKKRRTLPKTLTTPGSARGSNSKSQFLESLNSSPSTQKTSPNENNKSSNQKTPPNMSRCPICNGMFPLYAVEVHAASCNVRRNEIKNTPSQNTAGAHPAGGFIRPFEAQRRPRTLNSSVDLVPCPLCGRQFSALEIESHADECAQFCY